MSAVRSSPELVALGRDGKGEDRFTSRDMIAAEQRLERAAEGLAIDRGHGVADAHVTRALASAEGGGLDLSATHPGSWAPITDDQVLAPGLGYAASGHSAMAGGGAGRGKGGSRRATLARPRSGWNARPRGWRSTGGMGSPTPM